jgi:uncharacterized protein
MHKPLVLHSASSLHLEDGPIARDWVLDGTPDASAKVVGRTRDKTMWVTVWHCTAGLFNWHYADDEVAYIISGEAFISDQDGVERHLSAGDVVLFPAGSSYRWRVTEPVRKVAVLRKHPPRPLGLVIRAWHKLRPFVFGGPARASALSG